MLLCIEQSKWVPFDGCLVIGTSLQLALESLVALLEDECRCLPLFGLIHFLMDLNLEYLVILCILPVSEDWITLINITLSHYSYVLAMVSFTVSQISTHDMDDGIAADKSLDCNVSWTLQCVTGRSTRLQQVIRICN
jgi:hypothetical protein